MSVDYYGQIVKYLYPSAFANYLELEDEDSYNEVDELRELNLAFKCMEISGQILKNYWGSLRGDIKKNIGNIL